MVFPKSRTTTRPSPHVTGVRTLDGEEVSADLIVDAMGRRSKLPDWLEAIGARRPIEEAEDLGFIYYTRFFRSKTGVLPPCRTAPGIYFVSVGDSWACTNPSLGRGITIGLMHALGTVEVVRQHLDNPLALMLAHDSMTETRVTPWYRDTIQIDRTRIARFNALIEGRPEPQPTDRGVTEGHTRS